MIKGEPFDVPIVQPPLEEVIASGHVVPGSETPLATVAVAVAVRKGDPKPDISTPEAVRKMLLAAKTISYPNSAGGAAAGVSFDETLKKLGLFKDPLTFASTAAPNVTTNANDMRNPLAQTANIGFSQDLGNNLAIHLDGVYTRTSGFIVSVNVNTPDPVTKARPTPAWGRIVQNQSVGNATYKGLLVRLERRFAGRYQYTLSYTLAKHDNDFAGSGLTPARTDFYNPGLDKGPANNDRRHALVLSGAVVLPGDITVGAVWAARSTMPFSALAGSDLNGDGSNTDYVPGTTRNQGSLGLDLALVNAYRATKGLAPIPESQIDSNRYNRLDLRASKSIPLGGHRRLEVIGQVFNVLGTDNLFPPGGNGWITDALSSSFGRILQALPRQQAEVAARVVF